MSAYPELAPPDISIIIETTTVSPTIYIPTLPTCIVGPCYQIVEVTDSGAPNPEAVLATPAILRGQIDGPYNIAVGNKTAILKINGSAAHTVTLTEGATRTAAQVVADINARFAVLGVDDAAIAEVIVGTTSTDTRVQIRTKSTGSGQSLEFTGGTALTTVFWANAVVSKYRVTGYGSYSQDRMLASSYLIPSPRDNWDQLVFDPTNFTVALDEGGSSLRLLSSDSAIERYGEGDGTAGTGQITVFDDGDGDGYSPYIRIDGSTNHIKNELGAVSTTVPELSVVAAAVSITATTLLVPANLDGKTLIMSVSGSPFQVITFVTPATIGAVADQINAYFPTLASDGGAGKLKLDTAALTNGLATKGREASIVIHKSSSAINPTNLLDPLPGVPVIDANIYLGTSFPVQVGDEFYLDGVLKGTVQRILAFGTGGDQKVEFEISGELPEGLATGNTYKSSKFCFKSKNLTGAAVPSTGPTPEFYVTADGDVHFKNMMLRDSFGKPFWRFLTGGPPATSEPLFYGTATAYLGYEALRQDVSPAATTPALLAFDNADDIEDQIGPININNPLAMACYLAKVNCPGRTLYAIGLSEVSSSFVYGTSAAYTEAMEYLANHDVYTIVPLTQDFDILQNWKTHVVTYSGDDYKLERCCFGTTTIPTRYPNKVVASGTDGTKVSATEFNTGITALTALLLAEGIDPGTPDLTSPTDYGVYLTIESNSYKYQIKSVAGTVVTIIVPSLTDPTFYDAPADLTALTLVNETNSVNVRGAAISTKLGAAQALSDIARAFATRRMILGAPETVTISDGSLSVNVPSFYAAAVEGGKAAQLLPHVGFSNTIAPGIQDVINSNDYFSKTQMNIAAAGGIWWWFKPTPSSAVTCRHQLTTDTTTIESREWNLLRPLDYLAKMLRMQIRPYLGKYNITDDLLRLVDMALDGIVQELVDNKKMFTTLEFGQVTVVEGSPDSLEVTVDAARIYPFNKMTVRIRV